MASKRGLILFGILWILRAAFAPSGWAVGVVDHRPYGRLLKKYVTAGVVDYEGFKNEETELDRYLKLLENTDTRELPPSDQLAFYINAYNAWTIKLILGRYPQIHSIKDLGSAISSPFKKKICRIDGRLLSLDDIEHGIIRARFRDPRVHFVLNCASISCPPLAAEPYRGDVLGQQLDAAVRAFVNNPRCNRLEGNTLYVSKIFKWYADDFEEGTVNFFLKYAEGSFKEALLARKDTLKVRFLDYDWSLNGK